MSAGPTPGRPLIAKRILLLILLALVNVHPAAAFDDAAVAKRVLKSHILPGYERFAAAATLFAEEAGDLCRSPSAQALKQARAGARKALLAWGRIEHIRFGPISEQQRFDRLVFYPDQRGVAAKQISRLLRRKDSNALAPDKLAHASVAVQGFTAIDLLLFGKGSEALAERSAAGSYRCQYVAALARTVAATATETYKAWTGGYAQTWLQPGKDNAAFLSVAETTRALLRAYVTELEVVRFQRLTPVLSGDGKSGHHAKPLFAHSGLGMAFVLANVEGVRDLLTGSGFTDPALATDDKERSAMSVLGSVVTDLGFALRSGRNAMGVAPDVFASMPAREMLEPMIYSLKNAEETGRGALGALTGSSLGFNSLDGD